jgi:arsenate reductase (thioredoxin)
MNRKPSQTWIYMGHTTRRMRLALLGLLVSSMGFGCQSTLRSEQPVQVLMVCEHGSVKSLMAASYFNRAAQQRGLPYHAIARGVSPDASVPVPIASQLMKEGIDVTGFVPTKATPTEIGRATRVIVISLQPQALDGLAGQSAQSWLDVPAASVDYGAAKASLQNHIDVLLDELEESTKR